MKQLLIQSTEDYKFNLQLFADGESDADVDESGTTTEEVDSTSEESIEEQNPEYSLDENGELVVHEEDEVDSDKEQPTETKEEELKPLTYKVKVNGEVQEKTIDELVNGYQRQEDYSRKTQELARQRAELEQLSKTQIPAEQLVEQQKDVYKEKITKLSQDAMKLAHTRLQLDKEDVINEYDPLHIASYQNALFELQQGEFQQQFQVKQTQKQYLDLLNDYKGKEPENYNAIDAYAHYRLTQELPRAESDKVLLAIEHGKMEVVRDFIDDTRTKWYQQNMPETVKTVAKKASPTPPKVEGAGSGLTTTAPPRNRDMSSIRGKSTDEQVAQIMKWGLA